MTTTLLCYTLSKVTPGVRYHFTTRLASNIDTTQLIRELQAADVESPIPSPYIPARHDPSMPHKPSRTEVEDSVELFEGATDEDLQRLSHERSTPESGEKRDRLHGMMFPVLDERSALDKTVLRHANRTFYGPCWETIDGEDYDKDPEVIAEGFWVWRVYVGACECRP